jgi:hypothetical protein
MFVAVAKKAHQMRILLWLLAIAQSEATSERKITREHLMAMRNAQQATGLMSSRHIKRSNNLALAHFRLQGFARTSAASPALWRSHAAALASPAR